MKILLISQNQLTSKYLKTQLGKENIDVICKKDILNIFVELLYSSIKIILIDSDLNKEDLDKIKRVLNYFDNIQIVILYQEDNLRALKNQNNKSQFCYLLPSQNLSNISVLLKEIQYNNSNLASKGQVKYADIILDRDQFIAKRADQILDLRKKEFYLLEFFIINSEMIVSKDQILESVWGHDYDISTATVDSHISNLRKRLKKTGKTELIHNVRGLGYKFSLEK